MDSDEEEAHQIQVLDDHDAYAVSTDHKSQGLRMTPKVPPQFDGQSSWFEYEDLIDDWLGITTLDAEKHGPSLKNALVGSASFYKSMLDNALLRDPDRGLAHFKETIRPYFVKGVSHVFLWRFLTMFRTYRGQNEFVHWIGRFEIAQKRLLAAWLDLLDLSDLPEVGTAEFIAALTDEQRLRYNALQTDEERSTFQLTLREQTIQNRRNQHQQNFPLSDNLLSMIFLVQADLNEQQRERFVSSMNIRQIAMPQYTYLQVKQLFLELFCVSRTGVADPNIAHRKRSTFFVIEEGETDDGEQGFWVIDEDTGEEGFTGLYTESEFWVLSAKGTYSRRRITGRSFKKGRPKGYGKKGKRSRPGFKPRSRGKGYAATQEDDQDSALWGKGKGKGKKGKKGKFGKGKDSFKGMPSWKGKGKGDGNSKGGKQQGFPQQQQQANVAQQSSSSSTMPSQDKQETAHAEESWSWDETYWTDDWSWDSYNYYGGYEGDYSQGDWHSWSYFASSTELTLTEDKHSEDQQIQPVDGQTDQINRLCFSVICLFRSIGLGLMHFVICIYLSISLLCQCFCNLNRYLIQSIRNFGVSVASVSGELHSSNLHTSPLKSVISEECVYLNYDHGAQQALLCEYVDLGSHPTYVILDSGCTRAMGSRYAIDRLVQACQYHPKRDHIWFSKQPCSSKFSFANGEQSTVKERLVIHFRNDRAQTGWITTCVDILDKGKVPILFSVEQMRNLRMNIEHTPVGEFLTCPLFGMQRTALAVSTSNHPVLDIMALATSSWKPMYSFHTDEEITCPACNGKHRPHTNKPGCKKYKPSDKEPSSVESDKKETKTSKAKVKPSPAKLINMPKAKKTIPPEAKVDDKETEFSRQPLKSSGPSSGHRDGPVPERPEPQPEELPKREEAKVEEEVEEKKISSPKGTVSLALQRIHDKLQSPTELLKLHLKHYHMSTEQFKRRTSALKLPKEIYDKYDQIAKSCDTCSKAKIAPSRAKVSGIRSEVFGDLTFIDHGEVAINQQSKLQFLLLYDGATSLTTAYVVQNRADQLTIQHLQEYFETYQLNPKYIVADQAFMGPEMENYYNRQNIRPISLGPGTPWPNRAEAAIRMFKKQVSLMLISLKENPVLSNITYKQLLRQACIARNTMVTNGGVTPIEMAFGRRPADITSMENMTPPQLTSEATAPERQIEALRSLAMRKYLESKQSDDLRRDIASKLQLSDGPFFPGDKVYYWTEDKSKIKSDGTHGGKWIKGKLVSVDGSMLGVDLGTRIVKVNISKVRKDHNPIEDVDVPLDPAALASAEIPAISAAIAAKDASTFDSKTTCRVEDFANKIMKHDASLVGPEGVQYGNYMWEPVTKGKIDFLEMFSGSAKLSQVASMQGLRVGAPIDLRTGYDLLTADGRRKAMEVIEQQQPKIIHLAPVCGPWSQMQNINDPAEVAMKRRKYLPMVEFCAKVALYQIEHGRFFIIENPATSKIWFTKCFQRLLMKHAVTYGTLDMCAFGMRDPNGYYYYKPTSLLHNFPDGTLNPVFKRCSNKSSDKNWHTHQPLEGNAPGFGSRTKLAQVYPYRFCSTLIRSILPIGNPRALYSTQLSLAVDLLEDLEIAELHGVQNQLADLTAVEHSVLTAEMTPKGLPVTDFHTRRLLNRINALPTGNVYHPVQIEAHQDVSHVRQLYLSTSLFDNAIIFRGSFEALRVQYRHTNGVLMLWRKKDASQVFLRLHPKDLSHLIPSQWSAILFWNNDGKVPVDTDKEQTPQNNTNIDPPPGLPPSSNDHDMPDNPEQFNTPPSSPHPQPPDEPMPDHPHTPPPGFPPDDDPFHTPFQSPSQPHDGHTPGDDDDEMHSPQEPPDYPHNPFPGANAIPVAPDTPIVPNTIIPPHIEDTPMTHSTKRPPDDPPIPPATKARPSRQMPVSSSSQFHPHNHLGGDAQPSGTQNATIQPVPKAVVAPSASNSRKPKDVAVPDDFDDDEPDPDAGPSGVNGPPILPLEGDEPFNPAPMPENDPTPDSPDRPEEEDDQEDTDETIPYGSTDTDDTLDYNDLVIDDAQWSMLSQEQKICSNTASFSVPRLIDGSPVYLGKVESSSTIGMSYSVISERQRNRCRKIRSDIIEEYHGIQEEDKAFMTLYSMTDKFAYLVGKKRKEATQQEKRQLAKQFLDAKKAECQSWIDNEVFDLVDMRKTKVRNFVAGRWVLTVKKDKDGNFQKCKARWVLKGFQDKQKNTQQTDSPAASRAGFRCATQLAANHGWDLYHMDLKTAFLQGEAYDETRDIICQIPPEYGYPPYIGARLKKPGYGLNDAPRRWWQIIDKALLECGLIPTRADRCTYMLYDNSSKTRTYQPPKSVTTEQLSISEAIDHLMDPVSRNNAQGRRPHGFVCLHVDDLFMGGDKVFEQKVLSHLRKNFAVGSEDKNDIMFVGQRIKWKTHDKYGPYISCDQKLAVDAVEEIKIDKTLKDNIQCNPQLHTAYRSVLGQLNWLQSRTQVHICYKFSRCASAAANPTIGDVREINKVVRTLKSQYVDGRFWPLKGSQRILGMPDASYRNNSDKSSQRAHVIFLAEDRKLPARTNRINGDDSSTRGSIIDYESHKITTTTQSTTVAELNALMKCFGTCLFLRALWADVSGEILPIHLRTDANNLVTTAQTTHLPEQKETHHLIQMLRHESNTGHLDDLGHIASEYCLADPLTKHSAKPDQLVLTITTGRLDQVDVHPPFRTLLKHKAFLTTWVIDTLDEPHNIVSFFCEDISDYVYAMMSVE